MRKKLVVATFFLMIAVQAMADAGEYAVSRISPALMKNADVVLRFEEMRFEIVNSRESVQNYHYVITILNENGDEWAGFSEYYDKLRDVSSVQGYLYDAMGNKYYS